MKKTIGKIWTFWPKTLLAIINNFQENRQIFFAENWSKSSQVVVITLTAGIFFTAMSSKNLARTSEAAAKDRFTG
jgi:hypothetical protein